MCVCVQVKSSEGRQLAEEEHCKQVEKATMTDSSTFLQSVPLKKLYFETSAKTGDGVGELFQFIQNTLVVELERQNSGRNGKGRGRGVDQSIHVGAGDNMRDGRVKCCGN